MAERRPGAISTGKTRKHTGRSTPAGLLRPLLPLVGRAAAGANTASKRKQQVRESIEAALRSLERAELGERPDLKQLAHAAGVSFTTVWRHCQTDAALAARLRIGRDSPKLVGRLKEANDKLKRAELIIAEQWNEIAKLGSACRLAERKCEILENRMSDMVSVPSKDVEARSPVIANLRLVSDQEK